MIYTLIILKFENNNKTASTKKEIDLNRFHCILFKFFFVCVSIYTIYEMHIYIMSIYYDCSIYFIFFILNLFIIK